MTIVRALISTLVLVLLAGSHAVARAQESWSYVRKLGGASEVALPSDYRTCDHDATSVSVPADGKPVALWRRSLTAPKTEQCVQITANVHITVLPPALRKEDIKDVALDWTPTEEHQLDVLLDLANPAPEEVLRATRFELVGVSGSATFAGFDPTTGLALYRFTGISAQAAKFGGQLVVLPAEGDTRTLNAETGQPWTYSPGSIPPGSTRSWLVRKPVRRAYFAKPQVPNAPRVVAWVPDEPIDRFIDTSAHLVCGTSKEECEIVEAGSLLKLETPHTNLTKLAPSIELPSTSVKLLQATAGHLVPVKVSIQLGVTECLYEFSQLTRAFGGRYQARTIYHLKRRSGTAEQCGENQWKAIARRPGSTQAAAVAMVAIQGDTAELVWESIPQTDPNVQASYELALTYADGSPVATASSPNLVVEAATVPTANMRALTLLSSGSIAVAPDTELVDVLERKSLATGRPNLVELSALAGGEAHWSVARIGSYTQFPPCRVALSPEVTQICVTPPKETSEVLKLKATHKARADEVVLPTANPALLGSAATKMLNLGSIEFSTGLSAKPYRVALDLAKDFKVRCEEPGDSTAWFPPARNARHQRTVDDESARQPVSVTYEAFTHCKLRFSAPTAANMVERAGTQSISVKAGIVPTDGSAPKLELLQSVELSQRSSDFESCGRDCFETPLNLLKASNGMAGDYSIVQLELTHAAGQYEASSRESKAASELVVRVRRRPEILTAASERKGRGVRGFFTFTVAPLTLFRTPHSGRGAAKSSEVKDRLESPNIGGAGVGVLEPWNFDRNAPIWPFLTPQLHVGVLFSKPTADDKAYPNVSVILGCGFRTGVDTAPDAKVESALKFVLWAEKLRTFDDGRADKSWNFLFGFGVDIGTFGN